MSLTFKVIFRPEKLMNSIQICKLLIIKLQIKLLTNKIVNYYDKIQSTNKEEYDSIFQEVRKCHYCGEYTILNFNDIVACVGLSEINIFKAITKNFICVFAISL